VNPPTPHTIAILMMPEYGGLNASFRLAHDLRQRGHRVVYGGPADFAAYVTQQGLAYHTFADDPLREPPEFAEEVARVDPIRRFRRRLDRTAAVLRSLTDALSRWFVELEPTVVLLDPVCWQYAGAALKRGLPIVALNPSMSSEIRAAIAPVTSGAAPVARIPALTGARNLALWARTLLGQGWEGWPREWTETAVMASAGFDPRGAIHAHGGRLAIGEYGYRLRGPELVLMPRAFEFPGVEAALPDRAYAGTSVWASRADSGFDWGQLAAGKRLAYCSVGTLFSVFPEARRLFHVAIEAFARRADWQLLVSAGDAAESGELGPLPANVVVARRVPQLAVLERAQLYITHAGAGAIREAIHGGVPMIALPLSMDNHGLAARVAFHGLGVRGSYRDVTAAQLGDLIDRVTATPGIAAAVRRMRDAARLEDERADGVALVERVAARRS